jgi:hypothetical protein
MSGINQNRCGRVEIPPNGVSGRPASLRWASNTNTARRNIRLFLQVFAVTPRSSSAFRKLRQWYHWMRDFSCSALLASLINLTNRSVQLSAWQAWRSDTGRQRGRARLLRRGFLQILRPFAPHGPYHRRLLRRCDSRAMTGYVFRVDVTPVNLRQRSEPYRNWGAVVPDAVCRNLS